MKLRSRKTDIEKIRDRADSTSLHYVDIVDPGLFQLRKWVFSLQSLHRVLPEFSLRCQSVNSVDDTRHSQPAMAENTLKAGKQLSFKEVRQCI